MRFISFNFNTKLAGNTGPEGACGFRLVNGMDSPGAKCQEKIEALEFTALKAAVGDGSTSKIAFYTFTYFEDIASQFNSTTIETGRQSTVGILLDVLATSISDNLQVLVICSD